MAAKHGAKCGHCLYIYSDGKRAEGHTSAQHGRKVRQYCWEIGTNTPQHDSHERGAESQLGQRGDPRVRVIGWRQPSIEEGPPTHISRVIDDEQEEEDFFELLGNDEREFAMGLRRTYSRLQTRALSLKSDSKEKHEWSTLGTIRRDINEAMISFREVVRIYRDVVLNMTESFEDPIPGPSGIIGTAEPAAGPSTPQVESESTEDKVKAAEQKPQAKAENRDSAQASSETVREEVEKPSLLKRFIARLVRWAIAYTGKVFVFNQDLQREPLNP
ncbi:MAG: hypothetical protein Q9160_001373 [Pyrenula sp. 1 TL-2023]